MTALGLAFLAAAAVLLLADTARLSRRMPTQASPRSFALLPLAVGVVLVLLGLTYRSS